MDWILILFFAALAVALTIIIYTLTTLPQLGDERKNFIKMKAQSYSFGVVIFCLCFEVVRSLYQSTFGAGTYSNMNPFTFLVAISIVYLISLLIAKRKYSV
ncbi:hypothetical protein [Alkalihalobacillus pseudalcaliphilus]|uniref:hypothetical protein n=1 Tax=Alkalihalobacillus pseudalcaliphilus TaxID=79884 RepID=UPI00064DE0CA|nr:hypothetical protein [Alkalihalobacillus pseudalcaliphilus]KMK76840.1 hypothetical protein AB990_08045 [Alkalihalobacillus pseudalcaliphilus]